MDRVPRRDVLLLMGDLNAKVGADNAGRGEAMSQHGIAQMNGNGELLADFCIINRLVKAVPCFPINNYKSQPGLALIGAQRTKSITLSYLVVGSLLCWMLEQNEEQMSLQIIIWLLVKSRSSCQHLDNHVHLDGAMM